MVRLQKAIADSGFCSRRKAEEYIVKGKVFVNGERITELGSKVEGNEDGRTIRIKADINERIGIRLYLGMHFAHLWVLHHLKAGCLCRYGGVCGNESPPIPRPLPLPCGKSDRLHLQKQKHRPPLSRQRIIPCHLRAFPASFADCKPRNRCAPFL